MRREERIAVDAAARLHPNEWSSLEVRLLDLSPNGFRAQCDARVPAGSCVALELPNKGRVIAYVSWRRGDRFGAQFAEPIAVEGAGWGKLPQERSLARMLMERSQAYAEGEIGQELELRRRILNSLPMRRGAEPEPG